MLVQERHPPVGRPRGLPVHGERVLGGTLALYLLRYLYEFVPRPALVQALGNFDAQLVEHAGVVEDGEGVGVVGKGVGRVLVLRGLPGVQFSILLLPGNYLKLDGRIGVLFLETLDEPAEAFLLAAGTSPRLERQLSGTRACTTACTTSAPPQEHQARTYSGTCGQEFSTGPYSARTSALAHTSSPPSLTPIRFFPN